MRSQHPQLERHLQPQQDSLDLLHQLLSTLEECNLQPHSDPQPQELPPLEHQQAPSLQLASPSTTTLQLQYHPSLEECIWERMADKSSSQEDLQSQTGLAQQPEGQNPKTWNSADHHRCPLPSRVAPTGLPAAHLDLMARLSTGTPLWKTLGNTFATLEWTPQPASGIQQTQLACC